MTPKPDSVRLGTLGRAARAYAQHLDWRVFPLAARTKTPAISRERGGHGCLDATIDPEQIRVWWTMMPDASIGIATGAPSGIVVLDVDPRHGGDETLAELEAQHELLPETVEALTGGGGRHLVFRARSAIGIPSRVGIVPGLDVRGDGGYIVAPPSIHPNGRAYAWEVAHHPLEHLIADPPPWLLEQIRGERVHGEARPPECWRALVRDGVLEGGRNDAVARLAGHLLRRGVDPYVTLELMTAWAAQRCEPPLPADEVACTVDSIARRETARRRAAT